MADARMTALRGLSEVFGQGGYSNLVLERLMRNNELSGQERAFCTALFYGVVERRITLDWVLGRYSRQPVEKLIVEKPHAGVEQPQAWNRFGKSEVASRIEDVAVAVREAEPRPGFAAVEALGDVPAPAVLPRVEGVVIGAPEFKPLHAVFEAEQRQQPLHARQRGVDPEVAVGGEHEAVSGFPPLGDFLRGEPAVFADSPH